MIPIIHTCSAAQFAHVKKYIASFELDDRQLKEEEFLTVQNRTGLLGFGRIREYKGFSELCSLGIIESQRLQGLGKLLTGALIKKAKQPLYLVSIIPAFFEALGFHICNEYPEEIAEKLRYCVQSLPASDTYVVMKKC